MVVLLNHPRPLEPPVQRQRLALAARAGDLAGDAEFMLCGKAQGFSADYGHTDLLLGRRSREEIFPLLLDHLVRHDDEARAAPPQLRVL